MYLKNKNDQCWADAGKKMADRILEKFYLISGLEIFTQNVRIVLGSTYISIHLYFIIFSM